MTDFCRTVVEALRADMTIVAATLISHEGSTPRTAGARMLVYPDGGAKGTIGGGAYEGESIAAALRLLRSGAREEGDGNAPALALHFSLQGALDMDMVCGGRVLVLLELLRPEKLALFEAAAQAEAEGEAFAFALSLFFPSNALDGEARGDAAVPGVIRRARLSHDAVGEKGPRLRPEGDHLLLEDIFPARPRLLLFGAGHVSRATAFLAASCGFAVTVLDDRSEFLSEGRFPSAGRVLLPSLEEEAIRVWLRRHPQSPDSALVILTRGHSFDKEALAAALETEAGYIGMIGSRNKRDQVYARLEREGHAPERLRQVRCPVGLDIGAETPEEIAVSILAEIIAWRRKTAPGGSRG